ncbi:hypothetical protein [Flavobacterium sp. C4GT6]|uniref:hypothetical protein n=1 Tax=Flavobacterium sp. C4GT6 TaxID=3103818 RepID=UPI002ED48D54
MKTLALITGFTEKPKHDITLEDLISYPKGSLGNTLGRFLFDNSNETYPIPEKQDILRVLINKEVNNREEIAMHYYLLGNGDISIVTVISAITGLLLSPLALPYFIRRYKEGKQALRFYDLDYFRMLHLPLQRIKDTFLIQ